MRPSPVPSPEDQLRLAFARMAGLVIAALVLLVAGGVVLILAAATFFRFMYGG